MISTTGECYGHGLVRAHDCESFQVMMVGAGARQNGKWWRWSSEREGR